MNAAVSLPDVPSSAAPLPEALLLDHAVGATSPATGLLLDTHLSMSDESRVLFAMMHSVGGAFLEELDDDPLEHISAGTTLAAADMSPDLSASAPSDNGALLKRTRPRHGMPEAIATHTLPAPLERAENAVGGDRRWRWLGFGVATTRLAVSDRAERAHLLWAKGGTDIATHRHVGRETVLVLKGAFWDNGVRYGPGDVAVAEDGTVHNPHIDDVDDCLCLAVTEAPVHFIGLTGFLLNRFCRF